MNEPVRHDYARIAGIRLSWMFLLVSAAVIGVAWVAIDGVAKRSGESTVTTVSTQLAQSDAQLIGNSFGRVLDNEDLVAQLDTGQLLAAMASGELSSIAGLFALIDDQEIEALLEPIDFYHLAMMDSNGTILFEAGHHFGTDHPNRSIERAIAGESVTSLRRGFETADGERLDLVDAYVPMNQGGLNLAFLLTRDVTDTLPAQVADARSSIRNATFTVLGVMIAVLGVFVFFADYRISLGGRRLIETERRLNEKLNSDNAELERLHSAKNEFLSGLSHELKTPLAAMVGFVQILRKNRSGNFSDEDIERLEVVNRNGKRLDVMINDLLDLSRIENKRIRLSRHHFSLSELVKDMALSFEPMLDAKSQSLDVQIGHGPAMVSADKDRVAQVITNLISNASKYSAKDSVIGLKSDIENEEWTIRVIDQGVGIKANDQEKLFTLFYRTADAQNSSTPGTGIGLFVSKRIVELHGGEVQLKSKHGEGTTVTLRFPGVVNGVVEEELVEEPKYRSRFDELDELGQVS